MTNEKHVQKLAQYWKDFVPKYIRSHLAATASADNPYWDIGSTNPNVLVLRSAILSFLQKYRFYLYLPENQGAENDNLPDEYYADVEGEVQIKRPAYVPTYRNPVDFGDEEFSLPFAALKRYIISDILACFYYKQNDLDLNVIKNWGIEEAMQDQELMQNYKFRIACLKSNISKLGGVAISSDFGNYVNKATNQVVMLPNGTPLKDTRMKGYIMIGKLQDNFDAEGNPDNSLNIATKLLNHVVLQVRQNLMEEAMASGAIDDPDPTTAYKLHICTECHKMKKP